MDSGSTGAFALDAEIGNFCGVGFVSDMGRQIRDHTYHRKQMSKGLGYRNGYKFYQYSRRSTIPQL